MSIRERGLHRSFSTGQVSRLLRCRTDLKQFREGCFKVKNMINHVQGPVSTRPGFEHIADIHDLAGYLPDETFATFSDGSPAIRLVPFVFSETQSYILIFYEDAAGNKEVMFASAGGIVTSGGSPVIMSISGTFDIQNFDYAQYNDILFIAQPDRQPSEIIRNSHTSWTFQNQEITAMPGDWTANNYPERVSVYEQRVVYACNGTRPSTLWFSKSGYPYDFGVSSPQVVSDAVTYTIGAGRKDKILWLVSQRKLLVGTLAAEHTISGAGGEPLSYVSVSAVRHTSLGSEAVKPIEIADEAYFVEKLGRRVRRYFYTYQIDGYHGIDLNALNPDILTNPVKSWAYQNTPNSTIWLCDTAGNLLSLVTHKDHGVVAWQEHDSSGRDSGADIFIDVEAIPGTSTDTEVWAIVSREKEASGYPAQQYMYLEKLTDVCNSADPNVHYNMDSFYQEYYAGGLQEISVPHLSGRTVNVMLDGAIYPDQTVSSTSPVKIDFTTEYWKNLRGAAEDGTPFPRQVVVGIPYDVELQPVPTDFERITGGLVGTEGRLVGAIFHFRRTAPGAKLEIRDLFEETVKADHIPIRKTSDLDGAAPTLVTESIRIAAPTNLATEVNYVLIQDDARPMTVLGITDILEMRRKA